jgi:hypothetical protein
MGSRTRGLLAVLIVLLLATGGSAVAISGHSRVHKDDLGKGIKRWISKGYKFPKRPAVVPPGKTIRGVIGGDFHSTTLSGSDFGVDETLAVPAPVPLSDSSVFINIASASGVTSSDTNGAGCSGSPANPTAAAGIVCVYVTQGDCAKDINGFSVMPGTAASPFGFKVKWDCSAGDADTFLDAVYAYTAP